MRNGGAEEAVLGGEIQSGDAYCAGGSCLRVSPCNLHMLERVRACLL